MTTVVERPTTARRVRACTARASRDRSIEPSAATMPMRERSPTISSGGSTRSQPSRLPGRIALLAARALHGRPRALRPRSSRGHAGRDCAWSRTWRVAPRARGADRRHGPADALRLSLGRHPILELAERGLLGPGLSCARGALGDAEIARWQGAASRSRTALAERAPRLRRRSGKAARGRRRCGPRTDSPSSQRSRWTCSTSCVRRLLLARASAGDPEALSTGAALHWPRSTVRAALGLADRGAAGAGPASDLIAVRLDQTPFWPCDDRSRHRAGRRAGSRDTGRDGGNVLYGVDRPHSSAALPAAADARSRFSTHDATHMISLPHDHLIRNRKGWIGGVSSSSPGSSRCRS